MPTHGEMFVFLGKLLGYAMRTTSALNLDLPPPFWKRLVGLKPERDDLQYIDAFSWQMIKDLEQKAQKLTDEEFAMLE